MKLFHFSSRALEVAKLSCQESCRAGELFDRIEGRQQKIAGKVRNEFFSFLNLDDIHNTYNTIHDTKHLTYKNVVRVNTVKIGNQ